MRAEAASVGSCHGGPGDSTTTSIRLLRRLTTLFLGAKAWRGVEESTLKAPWFTFNWSRRLQFVRLSLRRRISSGKPSRRGERDSLGLSCYHVPAAKCSQEVFGRGCVIIPPQKEGKLRRCNENDWDKSEDYLDKHN